MQHLVRVDAPKHMSSGQCVVQFVAQGSEEPAMMLKVLHDRVQALLTGAMVREGEDVLFNALMKRCWDHPTELGLTETSGAELHRDVGGSSERDCTAVGKHQASYGALSPRRTL
jgi:hypothetical protein